MVLNKQKENCDCKWCGCKNIGYDFAKKILITLLGVFLVYVIFYMGTLMRNEMKEYDFIGKSPKSERMITISGYGKVSGSNDVAMTTIGYSNIDQDVAKAQSDNAQVMNKVMAELKEMDVAHKDIQSDYSIYPEYDYLAETGRKLIGYRVNSNVRIKIRDLSKIDQVLGLAGKYGANQVSGLQFTIDDPENLKDEAREKAIADAKAKAIKLANDLGVRLVSVFSYNEYSSGDEYYPKYYSESAYGLGGGSAVPDIASGSKDVSMNVNITYEIAP